MIIKRVFVKLFVKLIYLFGCICYDSKYLTGKYFDENHFTLGWQWILKYWFVQKVLRINSHVPWPVPPHTLISEPQNIVFHPDDMRNFHTAGSYFQGIGGAISIGKGTFIAPGVGIITSNHNPKNLAENLPGKSVLIGENSWIGMNSVILPGVELGPNTIVGAGSVVTKSFEGNCVIGGNPAKIIRYL